ncbi:MAG: ferrous iron transport protein A [Desulfarculaceae bacterium]|nr:ferrous iron transport protein A [Desulfarculaceae bacterium]MCF8048942.1 ferrous iron transport protein A [Desulfarculaceae bacterium]MCF8066544.1 ferrous iron transport protein A [Desulfarculaceae bacterium]MCF8124430.1 ferrous iron transport protein A [Desulfarculaceae bacterium]
MENFETLRMMQVGQRAVIKKITVGGEMGRRIRDMGMVPGTVFTVMGRAPLKDPVEIKLKGYNLTLRNNEADNILVQAEEA